MTMTLAGMVWLTPNQDRSFYVTRHAGEKSEQLGSPSNTLEATSATAALLNSGKQVADSNKKTEDKKKKRIVKIKYFSTQVIELKEKGPPAIKSGSKLLGFLIDPIDSRSQTAVRVTLPYGGSTSKMSIPKNSVLYGQFSFQGKGETVAIQFSKMKLADDGGEKKISGIALDAKTFTPGISGELVSSKNLKLAANVGLSMVSGMADVLTEKEALSAVGSGVALSGVEAKPTMKNALIQGAGSAAKTELGDTSSLISSEADYVTIAAGKEMVVELTEDFKNE